MGENPPANGMTPVPSASYPSPAQTPLLYDHRDRLTIFLALACAFLFCQFVLFGGLGFSVPLFVLVFYTLLFNYLKPKITPVVLITLAPVVLLSLCFALYDNEELRFLNVLTLIAFVFFNLAACVEDSSVFNDNPLRAALRAFFVMPFKNMGKSPAILSKTAPGRSKWKTVGLAALGIVIISPVALIVLLLLKDSDTGFSSLISGVYQFISRQLFQAIMKIVLSMILTLPLFSLLYSLRYHQKAEKKPNSFLESMKVADGAVAEAALTVVNLIYLLFIGLQIGYLFSAFAHTLPTGFTYAEYARSGFFELIAVAVINLGLIAGTIGMTRQSEGRLPTGCRISVSLLALLTLLIITTSISKMVMYISMYNLTPLRVYTLWFMGLLAFLFGLILLKMAAPKFRYIRSAALISAALFLILNFSNPDALIARYNVDRYLSGTAKTVDVSLLNSLSDSVVPQLLRLQSDPKVGQQANNALVWRQKRYSSGMNWENGSVAWLIAQSNLSGKTFTETPSY